MSENAPTDADRQTRIRVAAHEAGHCVVGLMLATDPTERAAAILSAHYAGDAPLPRSLSKDNFIIAVAAGAVAAELLGAAISVVSCSSEPAASLPVYPVHLPDGTTVATNPAAIPDSVRIARDCIEGVEAYPWKWIHNFETLMADARRLVIKYRPLILSVAEVVYREGRWIGSRNDLLEVIPNTAPAHVAPDTTAATAAFSPVEPAGVY